jgi:hypothetical protein
MDAKSGTGAEIDDLERLRDWLIQLAQGSPLRAEPLPDQGHRAQAERWQAGLKAPGERLSQLFF